MGEEEVEFKNQKSLFKIVKNISVLNVSFSKSVRVLIKNGCKQTNHSRGRVYRKKKLLIYQFGNDEKILLLFVLQLVNPARIIGIIFILLSLKEMIQREIQ